MLSKGEIILIKKFKRELEERKKLNEDYLELYDEFTDSELKIVLSSYHYLLIEAFRKVNMGLLRNSKYIHADISREIIDLMTKIESFTGNMIEARIKLIEDYRNIIKKIKSFIQQSGGTIIPDDFLEIQLIETRAIFIYEDSIKKEGSKETLKLVPIGTGAYAQVYSFYDKFYDDNFVLKRLNKNASDKDFERFCREFEIMKELNSIFIAKVYRMDRENKEYIMEKVDTTLFEHIEKNNSKLIFSDREYIIRQIILVFKYLNDKKILHRDISPKNILLKLYDDSLCIKLSDFGLVKIEESTLTAPNSEFRGSLNDPKLRDVGFDKYDLSYEMYALTRLIAFILTGKSNFSKIKDVDMLQFLNKGTDNNLENRYKDIYDLEKNFKILSKILKSKEK
ncbi:protein kinase domain-containing protein [Fusobacterium necrogenes]|uniref:protein kinase domain-containing protein n=1 Tax=Fusobacterium necrogenes TaxID=858 RepID=UPI00255C9177|nr:protein kinase [Fusobacterium necrogenes]